MATVTFSMSSTPLTGNKVFTGTDTDMQNLLDWARVYCADILPANPTNAQIGAALATKTVTVWKVATQQFMQAPPPPPPAQMTWA